MSTDLLAFGQFVRDLQPPAFPIKRSDALVWWSENRDAYPAVAQRVGDLVVSALLLYEGGAASQAADALEVAGVILLPCAARKNRRTRWRTPPKTIGR